MFKRTLLAVALAALVQPSIAAACGGGGAPPIIHQIVTPRPYSPAMATQVIGELASCKYGQSCEAIAQLREYGSRALPQLLAALRANTASHEQVLALIAETKNASAGRPMIAIANTLPKERAGSVYAAAARLDPGVFSALVDQLYRVVDSPEAWRSYTLQQGFSVLREQTLAWAVKMLPVTRVPRAIADIVIAATSWSDADKLVPMVGLASDYHANHRLAQMAIWRGATDDRLFEVFHAGLTSKSAAIRSDARVHFLADSVSAHLRARFLPIFEAEIGTRAWDQPFAETLVSLGSSSRVAFGIVFRGLTSGDEAARRKAANAVTKYVTHVSPALRDGLARWIEEAIAVPFKYAPDRFKKKLEDALAKLRAA